MNKLIYVSFVRLTDRVSRDWYVDYLVSKKIPVEFWDIVELVREPHTEVALATPSYLYKIKSLKELEGRLQMPENKNANFLMLISYSSKFAHIYRLLSKYDCKMLFVAQGGMPVLQKKTRWKFVNHIFHPFRLLNIVSDMIIRIAYRKLRLVNPYEVIFAAGEAVADDFSKKIIRINISDYDNFQEAKMRERLISEKYAVFLDINLPFHNDLSLNKLKPVSASKYYQDINLFFDWVEKKYNLEIVVAAHPTTNTTNDYYSGRKVFRLKTAELVKDAEFVISHNSTSISYAVLNYKPILFIYTDEMLELYKETTVRSIEAMAAFLGFYAYNVSNTLKENEVNVQPVDTKKYLKYKYDFLTTHESESRLTKEIVLDTIKSMQN